MEHPNKSSALNVVESDANTSSSHSETYMQHGQQIHEQEDEEEYQGPACTGTVNRRLCTTNTMTTNIIAPSANPLVFPSTVPRQMSSVKNHGTASNSRQDGGVDIITPSAAPNSSAYDTQTLARLQQQATISSSYNAVLVAHAHYRSLAATQRRPQNIQLGGQNLPSNLPSTSQSIPYANRPSDYDANAACRSFYGNSVFPFLPSVEEATTSAHTNSSNIRHQTIRSQLFTEMLLTPARSVPLADANQQLRSTAGAPRDLIGHYGAILHNATAARSSTSQSLTTLERTLLPSWQPYDTIPTTTAPQESPRQPPHATTMLEAPTQAGRFPHLMALQSHYIDAAALERTPIRVGGTTSLSDPFNTSETTSFDTAATAFDSSIHNDAGDKTHVASTSEGFAVASGCESSATINLSNADNSNAKKSANSLPLSPKGQRGFPAVLHRALMAIEKIPGGIKIAIFLPGGKAFEIKSQHLFEQYVLPIFFPKMQDFASFQRQLNLYKFKRIGGLSADRGAYIHCMFVREHPLTAGKMRRTKLHKRESCKAQDTQSK